MPRLRRCPWRRPRPSARSFEFQTLRRRLRELVGPEAREQVPAPAAVSGAPVKLMLEHGLGALAAVLEKGEAAVAIEPAGEGRAAVAVHDGGELVLATQVANDELAALWLLAAHAVVHDAKAQPGFAAAPGGPGFDTAVAAYLLAPERAEKERELFLLAGADEGLTLADGPPPEAAAATRAALTWRVAQAQRPRLLESGLERLFREIELPLVGVLADMEAAGVKIDPYRLGEITARVRDRVDELRDVIYELAGESFTIGSHAAARRPCSSRASAWSRCARARPATPRTHACSRRCASSTPSCRPSRSGASSPSCSTPTSSRCPRTWTRAPGGCTPPSTRWWPPRAACRAPTRTCRTSPSAPSSAPRSAPASSPKRACQLVVADYSQIELRLMASFAQEPALIDAYHRGEDVHRVTAAAVAGIPVEQVTKGQRDRAKATNFGIMYGLSAFGLSEQVDMPLDEAQAPSSRPTSPRTRGSRSSASASSARRRRTAT